MKKNKLTKDDIILSVTKILEKIIKENRNSLLEGDFHIRPGYGNHKFYVNRVTGSYDMSLQGLIHNIMYEEKIYEKILNKKQFEACINVIKNHPEAIYSPEEETDDDFEVRDLLDVVYRESIAFTGKKLLSMGIDVWNDFSEYLDENYKPLANEAKKSTARKEVKFTYGVFTDQRDGRTYKTVKIGKQTWMAENLDTDMLSRDEKISDAKTDDNRMLASRRENPAWCYYNNDPENGKKYGRLYNWEAATEKKLAPSGWRFPAEKDWSALIKNLGGEGNLKRESIDVPPGLIFSKTNAGNKNEENETSGFSALPAGCVNFRKGDFDSIEEITAWWSTEYCRVCYIDFRSKKVSLGGAHMYQYYSLRCIKE